MNRPPTSSYKNMTFEGGESEGKPLKATALSPYAVENDKL
jgi:hypothetical protein